MTTIDAAGALARFGLGPRPGDPSLIADDPQGAIAADIDLPDAALIDNSDLPTSADAYIRIRKNQEAVDAARKRPPPSGPAAMSPGMSPEISAGMEPPKQVHPAAEIYERELEARIGIVGRAPIGFAERLTTFWANHFAVQTVAGNVVRGLAGAYEREAVRPFVLGRFVDMLKATTQHPAMLVYLNNAGSIGPDSKVGERRHRGLNENLGRETLELHTVGVDAGYTQADVIAMSRVLTGWTVGGNPRDGRDFGHFVFRRQAHEPGPEEIMGVRYTEGGIGQGEAVLADLARHPATARHVARKLAHYFVSDQPPAALVDRLARTFTETDGDLKQVSLTLLRSDEAWTASRTKLKLPQEFVWSSMRALGLDLDAKFVMRVLRVLGQPLWDPPSPAGFHDDAATWLAPDAMTTRLDIASRMAVQARRFDDDPRRRAADVLGPALSADTREAVARAESRNQGLALLLMSPEFQRR